MVHGMNLEELILELKTEKDWNYRQGIAKQIEQFDSRAIQPLIDIWGQFKTPNDYYSEDSDANLHSIAENILVTIGTPAVDALIPLLNSDIWGERFGAIYCLHHIGDGRAIEPMVASLESADFNAVIELSEVLVNFGQVAVSPLLNALSHPNPVMRTNVARCLRDFPYENVLSALTEAALRDPVPDVRISAAGSLSHRPSAQVTKTLTLLLQDDDGDVREVAQDLLNEYQP